MLVGIAERWGMEEKFGSGVRARFAQALRLHVSRPPGWRGFARVEHRGHVAARRRLRGAVLLRRVRKRVGNGRAGPRARRNGPRGLAEARLQFQRDETSIVRAWVHPG